MMIKTSEKFIIEGHWITNIELQTLLKQFPDDMPLVGVAEFFGDRVEEFVEKIYEIRVYSVSGTNFAGEERSGLCIESDGELI